MKCYVVKRTTSLCTSLYFKALGMQFRDNEEKAQLSQQGVSEYFWGLFIERLQ